MSRFFHVIAVLASAPEWPQGDPGRVLTLHLPLTNDAQLDAGTAAHAGDHASVELAVSGRIAWSSQLFQVDDGWAVRPGTREESPLWRFYARSLRPGDYITLYAEDEHEQGYRIVNVEPD